MVKGYEFGENLPEELPSVLNQRAGEQLVPLVARIGQDLAETGKPIELSRIKRRFRLIGDEAVMIALRQADEDNLVHLDEVDGIIYPPRPQKPVSIPPRWM